MCNGCNYLTTKTSPKCSRQTLHVCLHTKTSEEAEEKQRRKNTSNLKLRLLTGTVIEVEQNRK